MRKQEGEQEGKHLTPVLQVPIPDKLIKRCRSSWIHHNPVVLDSVLIPQFLYWNERCHAKENVDLKHFEKTTLIDFLKKGTSDVLHEMQSKLWGVLSGERIDTSCYEGSNQGEGEGQGSHPIAAFLRHWEGM